MPAREAPPQGEEQLCLLPRLTCAAVPLPCMQIKLLQLARGPAQPARASVAAGAAVRSEVERFLSLAVQVRGLR